MKSFSIHDLKKELQLLPAKDLAELCLTMAKYKKDNKEFLTYQLVESYDRPGFIKEIKQEVDEDFKELSPGTNLYYVKKSLRKILRQLSRYCKYMNDKAVTVDLHIYFCAKLRASGIPFKKSKLIVNLYEQQLKKIRTLVEALHEDLQGDYLRELGQIEI